LEVWGGVEGQAQARNAPSKHDLPRPTPGYRQLRIEVKTTGYVFLFGS
jgi:hypothetical protein